MKGADLEGVREPAIMPDFGADCEPVFRLMQTMGKEF
jgi:hypothetical protein